jgi:ribulose-bisphosphate carboxylase large chain
MRRHLEAELGVRKGYLANITGEVAGLAARHDTAVDHGANAVMVNALPVGLSAVRQLRDHARVPLVAHFPLIAASSRLRYYGIHPRVWTQLQRLVGFDVIIMPGFGPRMMTPHDEVHACLEACREPLPGIAPSLPVPGGSDWAGTLAGVYRQIGSFDFGFVPGRGIFSHPAGPAAGARSIRAAWTAIAAGIPLADYARHHSDLAAAIEAFG